MGSIGKIKLAGLLHSLIVSFEWWSQPESWENINENKPLPRYNKNNMVDTLLPTPYTLTARSAIISMSSDKMYGHLAD